MANLITENEKLKSEKTHLLNEIQRLNVLVEKLEKKLKVKINKKGEK